MLKTRHLHRIIFRDKKTEDICSFVDSEPRKIGSALNFVNASPVPVSKYPQWKEQLNFIVAVNKASHQRLLSMHRDLLKNTDMGFCFYIDSKGSIGMFTALSEYQHSEIDPKYPACFRCTVVVDNLAPPPVKEPKPDLSKVVTDQVVNVSDQQASADHYNKLDRSKASRHLSQIFHMRNINNWIKTALIEHAISYYYAETLSNIPLRVIDFGCGKGGDLDKWVRNKSCELDTYVGVDIARQSLEDFAGRVANMASYNPKSAAKVKLLVAADMGDVQGTINTTEFDTYHPSRKEWNRSIPCPKINGSSAQDLDRADHFFRQVSSNLELGGVLISTTVDARVVADMAVKLDSESSSRRYKRDLAVHADRIDDNIDDEESSESPLVMNLHFDDYNWNRLLQRGEIEDKDIDNSFGIRYIFTLVDDPVKGNAVDAPEWLVPTGKPLYDLAAKHGLEVDLCQNFHDFVNDKMISDFSLRQTMRDMKVFNAQGTMSKAEWDICRYYAVIVFKKVAYAPYEEPPVRTTPQTPPSPVNSRPNTPPTPPFLLVDDSSGTGGTFNCPQTPPGSPTFLPDKNEDFRPCTPPGTPPTPITYKPEEYSSSMRTQTFKPQTPPSPPSIVEPPENFTSFPFVPTDTKFVPTSSTFRPSTPPSPGNFLCPISPTKSTYENHSFAPLTPPDSPPPVLVKEQVSRSSPFQSGRSRSGTESSSDSDDDTLAQLMLVRNKAIDLSREQNLEWSQLTESKRNEFLEKAKQAVAPVVVTTEESHNTSHFTPLSPTDSPPPLTETDTNSTQFHIPHSPTDEPPVVVTNEISQNTSHFTPLSPTDSPPPLTETDTNSTQFHIPHSPTDEPPVVVTNEISQNTSHFTPLSPTDSPPPLTETDTNSTQFHIPHSPTDEPPVVVTNEISQNTSHFTPLSPTDSPPPLTETDTSTRREIVGSNKRCVDVTGYEDEDNEGSVLKKRKM